MIFWVFICYFIFKDDEENSRGEDEEMK